MKYVILVRNPSNYRVIGINAEDDALESFETEDEAEQCAAQQPLCQAWGYQIVELEI
jgi:hypothetical protein